MLNVCSFSIRNAKVFTQRDLKFSYHILISSSIKRRCKFGAKLFFFIHFSIKKAKNFEKISLGVSVSFACLSFEVTFVFVPFCLR